MRVPIYTVGVALFAALAFSQTPTPAAPQQPSETATPARADTTDTTDKTGKTDKTAKDKHKDKDMTMDKTAGKAASDRPEEMKTQTYSGTLMPASCGGMSSTPAAASTSADRAAPSASADRSAPSGDSQSCAVSATTSQFALKLKDGKTVKFDDVGNLRAQEAFKAHKKWNDNATASKPVHVKASGILNGDQLTVVSID